MYFANIKKLTLACLLVVSIKASSQSTQLPSSIATTHPITADMVAALLEGLDIKQHLLFRNNDTFHVRRLTPSVLQTIRSATLIFVLGLGEPQHLQPESIEELHDEANVVVNLAQVEQINLRATSCQEHGGDHADERECIEVHYWLDLENLMRMQQEIAIRLALVFPEHAVKIMSNHEIAQATLRRIDARITDILKSADRGIKAIVWHDAYAYFVAHYNLPDYASANQADVHGVTLSGQRLAWLLSELGRGSCLVFSTSIERDLQAERLHEQVPNVRFIVADLFMFETEPSSAMIATEAIILGIANAFATCSAE